MHGVCLYVCPCMSLVPAEAKKGVKSPGTGVTDAGNHHMGAGNQTHVFWENSQFSSPLSLKVQKV